MKKNLLLIALLLTTALVYSQESVMLKYNFVKGKTYVQNTQVAQNIIQSMGGQEMKMQSDISANNEYSVEGVAKDGNATLLVSMLNASVHSAGMGRDTTMKFNDLKYKSRTVFSKEGKSISSVKVDSSDATNMMGQMTQLVKLQPLPGKSVKIGEKWQDTIVENIKPSGGIPFAIDTKSIMEYTLVGNEAKDGKEYLKISFTGTLAINGKGNQMGMDMFMEGTGQNAGFNYFDPKTSMIVYSEGNTEMDMSIAVSGQQNMTIPMTQSMKTIVKIEEKK